MLQGAHAIKREGCVYACCKGCNLWEFACYEACRLCVCMLQGVHAAGYAVHTASVVEAAITNQYSVVVTSGRHCHLTWILLTWLSYITLQSCKSDVADPCNLQPIQVLYLYRMSSRFSEHTFQMMRAVTRDSTKVSAMQARHIMRNNLSEYLSEAQGTDAMPAMKSRRGKPDHHTTVCCPTAQHARRT